MCGVDRCKKRWPLPYIGDTYELAHSTPDCLLLLYTDTATLPLPARILHGLCRDPSKISAPIHSLVLPYWCSETLYLPPRQPRHAGSSSSQPIQS